jgi:hypothetical protein
MKRLIIWMVLLCFVPFYQPKHPNIAPGSDWDWWLTMFTP